MSQRRARVRHRRRAAPALLAAALTLATSAAAQVAPHPGTGDPHVQSVAYDPEQVVLLRVASGYSVTVQFAPDERIEIVTIGNAGAWQATSSRRGDYLFVKPVQGGVETNLTVVTDNRLYHFMLQPAWSPAGDLPFMVRFTYPDAAPTAAVAAAAPSRYRLSGATALRPSAMSDDGIFTRIVWPVGVKMPAVYLIDENGDETVVNGTIRDGAYVIEGVARRLAFRLDRRTAWARRLARPPRQ